MDYTVCIFRFYIYNVLIPQHISLIMFPAGDKTLPLLGEKFLHIHMSPSPPNEENIRFFLKSNGVWNMKMQQLKPLSLCLPYKSHTLHRTQYFVGSLWNGNLHPSRHNIHIFTVCNRLVMSFKDITSGYIYIFDVLRNLFISCDALPVRSADPCHLWMKSAD